MNHTSVSCGSYAHPGGNMTGFTQFEATINTKLLQLLKNPAPLGLTWS
jgi:hypothetical protein